MISYTESNARHHREDQIKSKEALFGQESFVHSLKCKSMTLYSGGVKGSTRPSFGARADCCDCEASDPSTTIQFYCQSRLGVLLRKYSCARRPALPF